MIFSKVTACVVSGVHGTDAVDDDDYGQNPPVYDGSSGIDTALGSEDVSSESLAGGGSSSETSVIEEPGEVGSDDSTSEPGGPREYYYQREDSEVGFMDDYVGYATAESEFTTDRAP